MKGCLKSSLASTARKTVAFGDEEVYFADEWDRTPTEPAGKLSYEELLELKEIQRSLPRAQQLPDPVSGKLPSYLLDQVPIGLLPLLPTAEPTPPPPAPKPRHVLPFPPLPKKPAFAFLPLLPSRSPSPDPPTPSLTNASLESSPLSRASSSSPEPAFLSLADTSRRSVMILNGIEIALDDDDDEPPIPRPFARCPMSLPMRYPYQRETSSPWAG
ncbi:hypothetical protein J132_02692 [Termitomyces sp. J132]|nr:hypothetical protein J132_02692 [Termitomyces sp. J132]